MKTLFAFLGGAVVGAAAALLFTPESGDELRGQIREVLKRYGLLKPEEEDAIIDEIVAEIATSTKK